PEASLVVGKARIRVATRALIPACPHPLPAGLPRREEVLLARIRTDSAVTPAVLASWGRSPDDASPACPYCSARASAVGLRHILWNCPNLQHRLLPLTQARDLNLASPEDYYKWTRVNAHAGALLGFIRDAHIAHLI
ncbi:hypothetical protein ISCGN_005968, partial [Ixodes scapularis]